MRDRKSRNNAEQKTTIALRRSPRFVNKNQISVANPETPNPEAGKLSPPDSFSTPLRSCITKTQKNGNAIFQSGGRKGTKLKTLVKCSKRSRRSARLDGRANFSGTVNSQDIECDEISGKVDGETTALRGSKKFDKGSRRSARLEERGNMSKSEEVLFPQKQYIIEKMVTRSSVCGNRVVYFEVSGSDSVENSIGRARIFSKKRKAKVGISFCKKNMGNIEKRVTRSSSKTQVILVDKASNVSTGSQKEVVMSYEIKPEGGDESSKPCKNIRDVKNCDFTMRSEGNNCKRKGHTGKKRKRYQVEEGCEIVQGWTKEQELALQRAYFTAKPTPQFWKKVARMVPGKSAEECFERIHSDHLTPFQPPTRSRAKRKEPSPISFSASKLLGPADMKSKELRSRRRRTVLAQKTVRQLLQTQRNDDQDYEANLFAILEPKMDSSPLNFQESTAFASPAPEQGYAVLTTCRQMSSSAKRRHLPRLNSSQNAAFASPHVLKQIKNKALHEKYIDQLHCRDAKRKAESLRNAKNVKEQINEKMDNFKLNLVKVAKDALVSDAKDAINQFRSLQSCTSCSIDDDDNCLSDENKDEDVLC